MLARVVVVAQDPDWLRYAGAVLGRAGYDVVTVRDRRGRGARLARRASAAVDAQIAVVEAVSAGVVPGDVVVAEGEKWASTAALVARVEDALVQDPPSLRRMEPRPCT